MKQDSFDKFTMALAKNGVPCTVKMVDGEVHVELGWNYPDSLFHKVDKIASKLNLSPSVCAEMGGGTITRKLNVLGGPRRHF